MAGTKRELMTTVKRTQLGYLGHVLRGDCLERDCLLGMIEEKRARGRQRMKYMNGIKEMVEKEKMEEVVKLARNRRVGYSIVASHLTRHCGGGSILLRVCGILLKVRYVCFSV